MAEVLECTKDAPWKGQPGRVRHHDTAEVGEQEDGWPGGDIVRIRCRNCGHEWEQELPQ